jgi:hypothetical protein
MTKVERKYPSFRMLFGGGRAFFFVTKYRQMSIAPFFSSSSLRLLLLLPFCLPSSSSFNHPNQIDSVAMNLDFMSAGIIAVCPCVEVFCTSPLLMPSSPPDGFNFLSSQFEMVLILFFFFSWIDVMPKSWSFLMLCLVIKIKSFG